MTLFFIFLIFRLLILFQFLCFYSVDYYGMVLVKTSICSDTEGINTNRKNRFFLKFLIEN